MSVKIDLDNVDRILHGDKTAYTRGAQHDYEHPREIHRENPPVYKFC